MGFLELIRQVFATLRANRLRSALTMFGVTWGIASVMLLSGLATGFSEDSLSGIRSLGKDVVIVWGGRKSLAAGSGRKGDPIRFDEKTNEALAAKAQLFTFSPEVSAWSTEMRAGPRIFNTRMAGVGETYGELRNVIPDNGRWISHRDIKEARRVCVIGNEVRKKLFGEDSNPLHERVLIGGREFLIIGWKSEKKQNSSYYGPDNDVVWIPYTTQLALYDRFWFGNFIFAPNNVDEHELAVTEFKNIVAKVHKFSPEDPEALSLWDTHKSAMETEKVFAAINALMVAIGAITLMIGGLGVMNIMLVSVVERTREIGIRRAIGANAADIVKQFFLECLVITVVAGVGGMFVGWGMIELMNSVQLPEGLPAPILSEKTMLISAGMIGLVTILSGLYPALRAARVDPIQALHHE
ncbi:MAG: ABC transporter permease [Calditrichaeota bacterium]|nr:ABC transporter permease [Calditrichota bacterium]MCB9391072.1 ABC transporter permease [Calditrichota bacterium]